MNSYAALLERLFSLTRGMYARLDLAVSQTLCQALGQPQNRFATIHIAGTNGKGSVATLLATALQSQYAKVGLYTSPHIATFRERIRLNGTLMPIEAVEALLPPILALVDQQQLPASFFEITTALAWQYYAKAGVDIAVIETGLGGRLDATNVIIPNLSIITSISLDHTEILGDTLEAIAQEKAGIIKPHVPVVLGPKLPKDLMIANAKAKGSPVYRVEGIYDDYRAENQAIAMKALEVLQIPASALPTAPEALPRCRFECHVSSSGAPVICDVAHNPAGMQRLATLLQQHYPGHLWHIVIALSSSKEIGASLTPLQPLAAHWHLTTAPNGRSYPSQSLSHVLIDQGTSPSCIEHHPDVNTALSSALSSGLPTVVCGSFFIMSDALATLGVTLDRDPYDLNEKNMNKNV